MYFRLYKTQNSKGLIGGKLVLSQRSNHNEATTIGSFQLSIIPHVRVRVVAEYLEIDGHHHYELSNNKRNCVAQKV